MCPHSTPSAAPSSVIHPLDPITADEVQSMKQILADAGYAGSSLRYSYVMLREPDHATLDKFCSGDPVPREIGVLLLDQNTNVAREMVVDIPTRSIVY
uniref:AGAO-like N2 domain-containing protein n=1 Tax=Globisporangium ultimum (strain ATCC 200006 / CBS 805.95 / DAOM BR144) TaxID=431595 RepID=K3WYI1_GLOUD